MKFKFRNFLIIFASFLAALGVVSALLHTQPGTRPKTKQMGENYIFVDEAAVKKNLGDDESIVATLYEGERVNVLLKTEKISKMDGIKNYWYMVSARDNIVGYLEGEYLSDLFIIEDLDIDGICDKILVRDLTVFSDSVSSLGALYGYEVKFFKDGYVTSHLHKSSHAELVFTEYGIYKDLGFYPRVNLFSFKYAKRTRELNYVGAEDFYYVHRGIINKAFTYIPLEESCSTEIYFPNDEKGETNKAIMVTKCSDPEGYEEKIVYEWRKREFVQINR